MKLRHIFGLMLCALLCLFAIGTKTAVYRPHQDQVKNLTSAKVWQGSENSVAVSTPVFQTPLLLTVALFLLALPLIADRKFQVEQTPVAASSWFHPALSVRPPPTI